jgi:hypothetical protein
MRTCSVLGHAYRFSADGTTMRWSCERCGEEGGSKAYATAAEAERYARAFDRRDAEDVGKRPLLSLLPLWLARKAGRSGSSRRP